MPRPDGRERIRLKGAQKLAHKTQNILHKLGHPWCGALIKHRLVHAHVRSLPPTIVLHLQLLQMEFLRKTGWPGTMQQWGQRRWQLLQGGNQAWEGKRFKENEREGGKKVGQRGSAHLEISGSNALNQLHVRTSSVSSLGRVPKTQTLYNTTGFQQAQPRPKERKIPGIWRNLKCSDNRLWMLG